MTSHRLLSSLTIATFCFSVMTPAFAAATSTDDVLTELASFKPEDICAGRTDKNLGKCIGDVIKRIGAMRKDFTEALRAERDVWYTDNSYLGLSAEYYTKLQVYFDEVKKKRATFTELQRGLEKTFFTARKQVLESSTSESETTTRTVTSIDMDDATAKCAKQSDARGLRICLRQQVRLLDPAIRRPNAGPAIRK